MQGFIAEITNIDNMEELVALKEQIKEQIIQHNLHWKDRIMLYKKVQLINDYIQKLDMKAI